MDQPSRPRKNYHSVCIFNYSFQPPHIFERECKQVLHNTPLLHSPPHKTPLLPTNPALQIAINKPCSPNERHQHQTPIQSIFPHSKSILQKGKNIYELVVVRADSGARADARYRVQGPIPGTLEDFCSWTISHNFAM